MITLSHLFQPFVLSSVKVTDLNEGFEIQIPFAYWISAMCPLWIYSWISELGVFLRRSCSESAFK